MAGYLYALIIYPLEMFIETVFTISMETINSVGYAIIFVSVAVQLLVLPIYKRADELQEEERERQKDMAPTVKHIKETFRGDERVMILSTFYRVKRYRSFYQFNAVLPLLFQIPFFMAAYNFLSKCPALDGASFYFIKNMGQPDGMISIGSVSINVLPIAMTLINIISGMIYTRGLDLKDKLQLYITAGVFLVLLYNSPSGLVFYWTLNNIFSLLKNIFMKLVKHPRPVISLASILFVVLFFYKCFQIGAWGSESGRITMIIVLILGFVPMVNTIVERRDNILVIDDLDKRIFRVMSAVMALVIGTLIPVNAMSTAPHEFVVRGHYVNPLYLVLYCQVVAIGLFFLWGNVFFEFLPPKTEHKICVCMYLLVISGIVNALFFKDYLENMSMDMVYYDGFDYSVRDKLINLVVLIFVCAVCFLLYKYRRGIVLYLCYGVAGAVVLMSAINIYNVQRTIDTKAYLKDDAYYTSNDANFVLDRSGKNVVVLFEDRAFGPYLPYIFHEKPELMESFSGFTAYPNTISFGNRTKYGGPALFGGYDYTVYNMKKNGFSIEDSIKVMPRVFSDNGFDTTVFDVPGEIVELGEKPIEEFYREINPGIKSFYVDGVFKTKEESFRDYKYHERFAKKNFIRYGIFLSSPVAIRQWLYDKGRYLTQEFAEDRISFSGSIEELDNLDKLTTIGNAGKDTFTLILNNAAHSANINLQMPDYTLKDDVNNSPFLTKWREILSETPVNVGKHEIEMQNNRQIQSYEVNMATLLSIGRWMDFLKENDLYKNTRIIIVADHGYNYGTFKDMEIIESEYEVTDIGWFAPLLMIKDFGDGEFSFSDEFMTNADVPTVATEGLIDAPINPYTGNPINNDQKFERDQYVYADGDYYWAVNNDIYDLNNWKYIKPE